MKKATRTILKISLLLFFTLQLRAQDKPKIQVGFDIATENNWILFESIEDLDQFKEKALPILITGLDKYIGFLDFSPDQGSYQLKIILKNMGLENLPNYSLIFKLTGLNNNTIEYGWQFIEPHELIDLNNSTEILDKLKNDWEEHLDESYNTTLAPKLFIKIPFSLPDSSYYDMNGVVKQAILPFKKDYLMIDYENSEFEISTTYLDSQGDSLTLKRNGKGIGEVKTQVLLNPDLLGCIRIELRDFPDVIPSNGNIYIIFYKRINENIAAISGSLETAEAFLESNN